MSDPNDDEAPESEAMLLGLPEIPAELGIDPLLSAILHVAAFLDLSDDDVMEPDAAVDALEHIGLYMSRLAPERVVELQAQLDRLAEAGDELGWPEEAIEFVQRFLLNCGLGDDDGEVERDDDA